MSDAHERPVQGRTGDGLEQISGHLDLQANPITRLSDELDMLCDQATEENFDADKLDKILSALNEAAPLPDAEAFETQQGLQRFHERLAAEKAVKEATAARRFTSSRSHRSIPKLGKAVLIAAMCALIIAGTSAQAFHWNFLEMFVRWTSEHFHFHEETVPYAHSTKNSLLKGERRTYDSMQEMLDDFGIAEPLLPTWAPERFGTPTIQASCVSTGINLVIIYRINNELLTIEASEIHQENFWETMKDNQDADTMFIRGILYYLISSVAGESATWQNGNFECCIYGTVTKEELKQIVSSINEGR